MEHNHNSPASDFPGGSGGGNSIERQIADQMSAEAAASEFDRRTGDGRTRIQNSRMLNRAIKGGWLGQRFPTGATAEDVQQLMRTRPLDLVEKAVAATHVDLSASDGRLRGIAVRNTVAMERINQKDELVERPRYQQNNINIIESPEKRQEWIDAIMRRVGADDDGDDDPDDVEDGGPEP